MGLKLQFESSYDDFTFVVFAHLHTVNSPNPKGCPPIRTIFQSSPEALVKRTLFGNLEQDKVQKITERCEYKGLQQIQPGSWNKHTTQSVN